jgi:t-SNARE complex subunit (syntaxin)
MASRQNFASLKGLGAMAPDTVPEDSTADDEDALSPEERAELEAENLALQDQLDSELEHMQRMEQELAKITAMCELTSRKIDEQAAEIDDLHQNVLQAVDNIDAGNAQLQKASEATVSSRLFMLVFLLVSSMTLLFLHWYMD